MMKRSMKTMLGVTLLEIMLVLAIAAMVIVASIKYYKSATASSQANQVMSLLQAMTAAADNLGQGSGNYSGITASTLTDALGGTYATALPWAGGTITSTGAGQTFTITITSVPTAVCALVLSKIMANPNSSTSTCASNTLTYKYAGFQAS